MAIQLNTQTSVVDFLKSQKKDSSFTSRKKLFTDSGLNSRLGDFTGSATQNTALLNLLREQSASTPVEQFPVSKVGDVDVTRSDFLPGGQFAGGDAPSLTREQQLANLTTDAQKLKAEIDKLASQGLDLSESKDFDASGPIDVPPAPFQRPDLESIIDQFATGEFTTPETELAKEAANLARDREKRRAAAALEATQNELARRGGSFSGVRDKAEESLAAEHFANLSGISKKLASNIIAAARQEQARIQPEYRTIGGALYEIAPGKEPRKIIDAPKGVERVTYQGNIFERDPATGQWKVAFEAPTTDPGDLIVEQKGGFEILRNAATGEVESTRVLKQASGSDEEKTLNTTQFNLRAGISGLTQDQVADLQNLPPDSPQQWFIDKYTELRQRSADWNELVEAWSAAQTQLSSSLQRSSAIEDLLNALNQAQGLKTDDN